MNWRSETHRLEQVNSTHPSLPRSDDAAGKNLVGILQTRVRDGARVIPEQRSWESTPAHAGVHNSMRAVVQLKQCNNAALHD